MKYLACLLFVCTAIFLPIIRQGNNLPWIVPNAPRDGHTSAVSALQLAINEAEADNNTIVLAPGAYYLDSPLQFTSPINILGCGVQCSKFVTTLNQTILEFNNVQAWPLTHGGTISEVGLDCNWQAVGTVARQGTGIALINTQAMTFRDVGIHTCNQSITLAVANNSWDERNIFDRITLDNFTSGIEFDGPSVIYGHNWFENIEFNTYLEGDALVRFSGDATAAFNMTLTANGNMNAGCMFDLTNGNALLGDNDIRIMVENGPTVTAFCGGTSSGVTGWWGNTSVVQAHGFIGMSPGNGLLQSGPFNVFNLIP
jgi:hypothetical protein